MGSIFGIVFNMVIGPLLDKLTGPVLEAYKAHIAGQISKEQLRAEIAKNIQDVWGDVAKSSNEAVTKTFESFMQTLRVSRIAQWVWGYLTFSQITFIIWLEVGVPYLSYAYKINYPGVGSLDQWAMGAVLACVGLGPLVLKAAQPKVPSLKELA